MNRDANTIISQEACPPLPWGAAGLAQTTELNQMAPFTMVRLQVQTLYYSLGNTFQWKSQLKLYRSLVTIRNAGSVQKDFVFLFLRKGVLPPFHLGSIVGSHGSPALV